MQPDDVGVEVAVVDVLNDLRGHQVRQALQVHHIAGARIDRATDDHLDDVIVSVEVDAFAVETAVFILAQARILQLVGGIESLATADAHIGGGSHAGRNVLRRSKSATSWRACSKAFACPASASACSAISASSAGRTRQPKRKTRSPPIQAATSNPAVALASNPRRRFGLPDAPTMAMMPALLITPWMVAGVRAGWSPGIVSQSIQATTPAAAAAAGGAPTAAWASGSVA